MTEGMDVIDVEGRKSNLFIGCAFGSRTGFAIVNRYKTKYGIAIIELRGS